MQQLDEIRERIENMSVMCNRKAYIYRVLFNITYLIAIPAGYVVAALQTFDSTRNVSIAIAVLGVLSSTMLVLDTKLAYRVRGESYKRIFLSLEIVSAELDQLKEDYGNFSSDEKRIKLTTIVDKVNSLDLKSFLTGQEMGDFQKQASSASITTNQESVDFPEK